MVAPVLRKTEGNAVDDPGGRVFFCPSLSKGGRCGRHDRSKCRLQKNATASRQRFLRSRWKDTRRWIANSRCPSLRGKNSNAIERSLGSLQPGPDHKRG